MEEDHEELQQRYLQFSVEVHHKHTYTACVCVCVCVLMKLKKYEFMSEKLNID
jgi:hypothetical protein